MRVAIVAALLVVAVGPAIGVADARAEHFQGKRYLPNRSGNRAMPGYRARRLIKTVVRRVFAVQAGTEIYACSRHSFTESGCDFAFTSKLGNYTCGNATARSYRSRIVVRYSAYNEGCGDF